MNLAKMNLDQLEDLQSVLQTLSRAGKVLVEGLFDPEFDLTPGLRVQITLSVVLGEAYTPVAANQSAPSVVCAEAPVAKVPATGAPVDELPAAHVEVLTPPGRTAEDPTDGEVTEPQAPSAAAGGWADSFPSGGVQPVAVAPGSPHQRLGDFTEAEDGRIVACVVAARRAGQSVNAVIKGLAAELNRNPGSINGVIYGRLKSRIDREMAKNTSVPAAPVPAASPAAVKPAGATDTEDALGQHLWNMSRKGDWHIAADVELMQMAIDGDDLPIIADQLGKDVADVKTRFLLLRKGGTFGRAEILARLKWFLANAEVAA